MIQIRKLNFLFFILIFLLSSCGGGGGSSGGGGGTSSSEDVQTDDGSGGNGNFKHTIYNPFGFQLDTRSINVKQSDIANPLSILESAYIDFKYKEYQEPNTDDILSTYAGVYCLTGGEYRFTINLSPGHASDYSYAGGLYKCQTTQNLINNLLIPNSWSTDNLILYCNDGKLISSVTNNFDFITSYIETYKACILRNVDKEKTIFYGLDVGNTLVDGNYPSFENIVKTGDFEDLGNNQFKYIQEGRSEYFNNQSFTYFYDQKLSLYTLSDFNDEILSESILTVFPHEIDLSRIALHRSFSNKKVYGYETPAKLEGLVAHNNNLKPVYTIKYEGFSMDQSQCSNMLAYYWNSPGLIPTDLDNIEDNIWCAASSNEIKINSYGIDGSSYGKPRLVDEESNDIISQGGADSFNLFKNIIFSLN